MSSTRYFYGIKPIRFIWHGAYSDPELLYNGRSFCYWDIENALWNWYQEENPTGEEDFPAWVKNHGEDVKGFLDELS